jgi:hypothetical protein
MTNVVAEAGTVILKAPSAPVWVPVLDPLTVTEAPVMGDPSFESVTLPEIVLVCACAENTQRQAIKPTSVGLTSFVKFINGSLLVIKRVQNTHFILTKCFLAKKDKKI